jgi:hypothetical protein
MCFIRINIVTNANSTFVCIVDPSSTKINMFAMNKRSRNTKNIWNVQKNGYIYIKPQRN